MAGASGWLGGTIAREALERGHEVTAIGRDPERLAAVEGATPAVVDVTDLSAFTEAVGGQDAVVVSVTDRSTDDRSVIPAAARSAIEAVSSTDAGRLLYIGGGSTLLDADGNRFIDSPDFPAQYRDEALAGAESLEAFRNEAPENLDWVYLSPPPHDLVPGDKRGGYAVAADDRPVEDAEGHAEITAGDLAAAVLDELERPQFSRQRFTVGYR